MISETLSILGAMYHAVGPGLILAFSLPLLLVALVAVVRAMRTQMRS